MCVLGFFMTSRQSDVSVLGGKNVVSDIRSSASRIFCWISCHPQTSQKYSCRKFSSEKKPRKQRACEHWYTHILWMIIVLQGESHESCHVHVISHYYEAEFCEKCAWLSENRILMVQNNNCIFVFKSDFGVKWDSPNNLDRMNSVKRLQTHSSYLTIPVQCCGLVSDLMVICV